MTFLEHTYERRQHLSSLWYVDELVYGEIGPLVNTSDHKHAFNSHFKQINASHPNLLPNALAEIEKHMDEFVLNHPVNFEDLYSRTSAVLKNVTNGDLVIYDISLYIGISLYPKVLPKDFVYLHNNQVFDAAQVLLPSLTNNVVSISLFSSLFPNMSAMEIEDLLCIYADQIIKTSKFDILWLNQVP